MYNPQLDTVELMDMYEQPVATHPTLVDDKTRLLRGKLTFEETKEFLKGLGLFIGMNNEGELDVFTDYDTKPNLVEVYDAIVDMNVVNYGAANAFGMYLRPGWEEVKRSNMSKRFEDGSIRKNDYGKVIKPPTYSPANLEQVLTELKASKFGLRDHLGEE